MQSSARGASSAHNDIGIAAALVDSAFVAVHLRAVGNVDLDDLAVTDLDMLEFHGDGHVEGVGVVDDIEDVSCDGKHLGWIDARERAVVLYAEQEQPAAERVGERADGFDRDPFSGWLPQRLNSMRSFSPSSIMSRS